MEKMDKNELRALRLQNTLNHLQEEVQKADTQVRQWGYTPMGVPPSQIIYDEQHHVIGYEYAVGNFLFAITEDFATVQIRTVLDLDAKKLREFLRVFQLWNKKDERLKTASEIQGDDLLSILNGGMI